MCAVSEVRREGDHVGEAETGDRGRGGGATRSHKTLPLPHRRTPTALAASSRALDLSSESKPGCSVLPLVCTSLSEQQAAQEEA